MSNYLGDKTKARGIRNNNPGNLVISAEKWIGKLSTNNDGHFEQFVEMKYGVRALMRDIYGDITRKKMNTVRKLISSYAPSFENNTANYITTVLKIVGRKAEEVLEPDEETIVRLAKAIIFVENGNDSQYVIEKDYRDALEILGITLKKKATRQQ